MFKQIVFLMILSIFLQAEDLIISYRGAFVDHQVHNESFMVSKAMIRHTERKIVAQFDISIDANDENSTAKDLIKKYQDAVIDQLFKQGILLTDSQKSANSVSNSKLVITLPAQKITATVKASLVTIAILQ